MGVNGVVALGRPVPHTACPHVQQMCHGPPGGCRSSGGGGWAGHRMGRGGGGGGRASYAGGHEQGILNLTLPP